MISLPVELLYEICDFLTPIRDDIYAFRLVNKNLAHIGAKIIFKSLIVCVHPLSYQKLVAASQCPAVANYVQKLHYHNLYFDDRYQDREEWIRRAKSGDPYFRHETEYEGLDEGRKQYWDGLIDQACKRTDEELNVLFDKYMEAIRTQQRWWDESLDARALEEAISRLPKLKHLSVASSYLHFTNRLYLGSPEVEHPFGAFLLFPKTGGHIVRNVPEAVRQLTTALQAFSKSRRKLEALRAGQINWTFFEQFVNPILCEELIWPLTNVTWLDLEVSFSLVGGHHALNNARYEADAEVYKEPQTEAFVCRASMGAGIFHRFLSRLTNLTELEITFKTRFKYEGMYPASWKDMFGQTTWPKLRTLNVTGVDALEEDMISFLTRHQDTLTRLVLTNIELVDTTGRTSWTSVLSQIHALFKGRLKGARILGDITTRRCDAPFDLKESWFIEAHELVWASALFMFRGIRSPLEQCNMNHSMANGAAVYRGLQLGDFEAWRKRFWEEDPVTRYEGHG